MTHYFDSVNGGYLKPELVREARAEELRWVKEKKIWEWRPTEECWNEAGAKPVPLKWVDTNKGDDEEPNYRSTIVAREIKKAKKIWQKLKPKICSRACHRWRECGSW